MTWYLKYRPQTFSDLDLVEVRESLTKGLASKDLPHAWLFAGPRGLGKTSAARILAKYVNCNAEQRPCNECEMCRGITSGSAPDVIEIDAASNRGIEEIRELRGKVGLAPMQAKYKVFIIDEVHMLTTEAANALLKTLEEPPEGVLFVLCTTEMEKLPETVRSRCRIVRFKYPTLQEISELLKRVAIVEKVKIDDRELKLVAQAARGSFRDAIKLLEQSSAEGNVVRVLGNVVEAEPEKLLQTVIDGDTVAALQMVNRLVENGGNVRGFIESCVEQLREKLLVEYRDTPLRTNLFMRLIEGLEKAYERTKTTAVPQLPLEIFIIESANDSQSPKSQVLSTNEISNTEPQISKKVDNLQTSTRVKYKLADVKGKWGEVMKMVKPKNHSVEALLRSTRPVDFDGERLVLEVFYKFHKDKLETDKCRQIVESSVAQVLGGGPVRLEMRLGVKEARVKRVEPSEAVENIGGEVEEDIVKAAAEIFKVDAI